MAIMKVVLFLSALIAQAVAYLEPPPTTAASNTIADCSYWAIASSVDTCASISNNNFITLAQFNLYVSFTLNDHIFLMTDCIRTQLLELHVHLLLAIHTV